MKKSIFPLFLILNCYCGSSQSSPWFSSSATLTAGKSPVTLVIEDFNGDGKADIAAGNNWSNSISIFLGSGNGNFSVPTTIQSGLPNLAVTRPIVVSGDFNNDGKKDIGSVTQNSNAVMVSVNLGNGSGSFYAAVNYTNCFAAPGAIQSITTADYNGDGKADIGVGDYNNHISVFFGSGNGSITSCVNYTFSALIRSLISSDFNNDGIGDLAGISGGQNMTVLLGSSSGTFAMVATTISTSPNYIAAADFNGDNKQDIVLTNSGLNTAEIYSGNGTGALLYSTTYTINNAGHVVAKDLNGDAKIDLAITKAGEVEVLKGLGNGSFITEMSYPVNSMQAHIVSGDVNGDNSPDLLIGSGDQFQPSPIDTINILFNQNIISGWNAPFLSDEPHFDVYPNPGKGQFILTSTLSGEHAQLEVVDFLGRTVRVETIFAPEQLLDLSAEPDGFYSVRLVTENRKTVVVKIIKCD